MQYFQRPQSSAEKNRRNSISCSNVKFLNCLAGLTIIVISKLPRRKRRGFQNLNS